MGQLGSQPPRRPEPDPGAKCQAAPFRWLASVMEAGSAYVPSRCTVQRGNPHAFLVQRRPHLASAVHAVALVVHPCDRPHQLLSTQLSRAVTRRRRSIG